MVESATVVHRQAALIKMIRPSANHDLIEKKAGRVNVRSWYLRLAVLHKFWEICTYHVDLKRVNVDFSNINLLKRGYM